MSNQQATTKEGANTERRAGSTATQPECHQSSPTTDKQPEGTLAQEQAGETARRQGTGPRSTATATDSETLPATNSPAGASVAASSFGAGGVPGRPILRYHGGKWLLAEWIIGNFPEHRVYVEPFGGAASVLMQKPRSYAEIYNDLDGELVNVFRVVRDRGEELKAKLELTPFSRDEYRLSFELAECPLEQARRTVMRSYMGFGSNALCRSIKSGFRSNSNRSGTTPAHDWRNYPGALVALVDRLRGVVIENRNAAEVMLRHDGADTLHYCDPPYVHDTRSQKVNGHHGYTHEMTDEQHRETAAVLRELKGMVIVSGYHSPLYDELFDGWRRVERRALADGARERIEVLWMNYDAPHGDLFAGGGGGFNNSATERQGARAKCGPMAVDPSPSSKAGPPDAHPRRTED